MCTTANSPFVGDLFHGKDCASFCFDVQIIHDGTATASNLVTPGIVFLGTNGNRIALNPTKPITDPEGSNPGWHRICAEIKRLEPGEPIPSGGSGTFSEVLNGSTPVVNQSQAFNDVLSDVAEVQLYGDFTSSPSEIVGYNNFCLGDEACPQVPETEASIEKTCDAPVKTGGAGQPLYGASCQIAVVPGSNPKPGDFLFLEEELTAPDGTINGDAIDALTAAGWDCDPAAPPFGATVPQCFILEASLPAGGVTVDVGMTLTHDNDADWTNCARLARMGFDPNALPAAEDMHASYASADVAPFADPIGESCVDIPVRHPEDPPPPPTGAQCTPFTPDVACDQATGTWVVSLQNSLSGSFDPSDIKVSTAAQGITLIPGSDPLNFRVAGAQPGDSFAISTEAVQNGAGGGKGLDLCCMGEVEITIPEGETCEPPQSDRDLTVHKTCAPLEAEGADGENYECVITVDYSGPAPTATNPIKVSDTLINGGPMQIWSFDPPVGDASAWSCANAGMPTAGPLDCEMHTGLLPGKPASYWQTFSQSFALRIAVTEPFTNCADASVNDQTGAPIEVQSCFSKGDFDLEITKKLADVHGGECQTGQACTFIYEVTNVGTGAYTGPITLFDGVTMNGTMPISNGFASITPAICAPADLEGPGCTDTVALNPGDSTTYQVDFVPPVGFGNATGENCVSMADSSIAPEEDLFEIDGHSACAEFIITEDGYDVVDLTIEKTLVEGNADFATFQLAPMVALGTLSAGDVVTVTDDLGSAGFALFQASPAAATDGWVCTTIGTVLSCDFAVTASTTTLPPILVQAQVGAALWDENCANVGGTSSGIPIAETDMGNNQSCVQSDFPEITEEKTDQIDNPRPVPTTYDLVKACEAAQPAEHQGVPGWSWACTLTLSVEGAEPRDDLVFADRFTPGSAPFGAITSMIPISDALDCAISASRLSGECRAAAGMLDPGSDHVVMAQVFAADLTNQGVQDARNCAQSDGAVPLSSCVTLTAEGDVIDTPTGAPELELVKSAEGACSVNKSAQSYGCDFSLTLRNVGDAPYSGPAVIDDLFGSPKPTQVNGAGDGWNCFRSDGKGTSCVNGGLALQPGQASTIRMQLTLPGLVRGGQFENCAAIGVGDSKFQRASIVQQAMQLMGIDGGPVDGAPGRKTREGVRALQDRLGLEPTGDIDDALFAALGVPAAADVDPSCVTVDLPPMPVVCEPGQERNSKGVCFWPKPDCAPGQKINSKGQCYTPRVDPDCAAGQKLNSKGQCYTPREECQPGQKRNSKGQCYTPRAEVSCDSASTVKRNGACVCRYKGMRQVTDSRCACSNGLPVVPGAGCVRIEKKRSEGDVDVPGKEKTCVTLAGVKICR
ncbi:peptidoglycan-binding domain-containing protein [Tropicibacter oceani]|uniref:Peptidoglycan-binding domain-containing protein n=1 Tax=Tropicibacter oceani TaxID=3058420 RepID=A0ABY8QIY4_9RHOB|nr:peptidoglycan-binding domain-containing protein [Tropicibacter oceani]WGW04480.1 peptidoglycan-binding domain-containing protein [Tropicibacter oceani]